MRPFYYTSLLFIALASCCLGGILMKGMSWMPLVVVCIIYLSLLVIGATKIQWNFYTNSLHKGNNKNQIALSFDDGPAAYTAQILDVLKLEKVEAAFFCVGKNAMAHPEMVKRWERENHLIGNHSYNHSFHFDWQTATKMKEEIEATNRVIQEIIGKKPRLFRPPYGVTNPNLAKAVKQSQMLSIGWNIRSYDTTAKNPQQLLERILSKVEGGDIILLHDSMQITASILKELIVSLRHKGFSFVRLDQLLEIEPYE